MKNLITLKIAIALFLLFSFTIYGQSIDSSKMVNLEEINIYTKPAKNEIVRLPEIQNGIIYSGKKNEVIKLGNIDADLSINNSRQVFGKVPGLTVWENDGSGIQVGIATRGLSPNRSWEFNTRQNGADISAEVFGYPEAYYTPPLEAVEKIEIVRGAGGLQYGPQFGGLLNYVVKRGTPNKPISFESQQTIGGYGLFNSFNGIGGTYKKVSYYAYMHHRSADSWRKNNNYNINTGYASITYSITSKMRLSADYTKMKYDSKQPGGLTDAQFEKDPREATRNRNWMDVPWNVASLTFDYNISENSYFTAKLFGVVAERNSVGFVAPVNVADTFNNIIKSFNPRQVDRDSYKNYGGEVRYLQSYQMFGQKQSLSLGIRVYKGQLERRQLGRGTIGSDLDLNLTNSTWGRDLSFHTDNYALFAEHLFKIGKRLSITPGARYEIIDNRGEGYYRITAGNPNEITNENRSRQLLLLGTGLEFKTTEHTNVYANFTQNYRPVTFSELTPSGTTDVIDPNLKDAFGYNIDGGFRGTLKKAISFDIGGFYLFYDNRIGTITQNGSPFRTNIGASVSKGIESYLEVDVLGLINENGKFGHLNIYASYSFIDAEYTRWDNPAIVNDPQKTLVGKKVEYVPQQTQRYGVTYIYKKVSATFQLNNIDAVYTDAINTEAPNATATVGKIPAYTIMDASITYGFLKNYNIKAGVNNLANVNYFTRRAGGYPGPGLMPGNGRTLFFSIGAKF
jgi:Fe(3+) dicitrate transport protein